MGSALESLAAFKVAIRGRGASLFRVQLVRIHCKTHRAAWLAPLKSGLDEDLVQPFGFRLLLHNSGAGYDHGIDVAIDGLAFRDLRRRAQVLDASVGAG